MRIDKGQGQIYEAAHWVADVDFEMTPVETRFTLRRGELHHLVGRPFVELWLSDGSRYEILLPVPTVQPRFPALIIKQTTLPT